MKNLVEEFSEEFKNKKLEFNSNLNPLDMFEIGINSKWVEAEKIKAQMLAINWIVSGVHPEYALQKLEQQLKELENEK